MSLLEVDRTLLVDNSDVVAGNGSDVAGCRCWKITRRKLLEEDRTCERIVVADVVVALASFDVVVVIAVKGDPDAVAVRGSNVAEDWKGIRTQLLEGDQDVAGD